MKKSLFPLLLFTMLLGGCASQSASIQPVPIPPAIEETIPPLQDTLSFGLLSQTGALEEYSSSLPVSGFLPMEENLLFFYGHGTKMLTLFNPETGTPLAIYEAPVELTPENATVQLLESGFSFFREDTRETVVLDERLQEVRHIPAPEEMTGIPLLSRDGNILYYCTASAVRCLDLGSNISQILKETAYPTQSVAALLLNDSVIQLHITDSGNTERTLFLSSENGQLLGDCEGSLMPETSGSHYFLRLEENQLKTLLFGSAGADPMVLHPATDAAHCFFLGSQVVTTGHTDEGLQLELYNLETGLQVSGTTIPSATRLQSICLAVDGRLWFLCTGQDGTSLLYRWDPNATQSESSTIYTAPYYTRDNPDYEGLAVCSLYAQEIGKKYGIEVLVYKDAVMQEPWDYHLEYEHQASVLLDELEALDNRLSRFPAGFLETLVHKFTALKICLVRSASGSPESGSLEAVNGIQFMNQFDAYIVLATNYDTEYALYHELSHLMETVVLTESSAYDRWENLNPEGFQYDNDYILNQTRDGSAWLKPGSEYFIDTYAMSYAKEDRARLLEYAMTEGHTPLFSSPNLQRKLKHMCIGIRDAFGLTDVPEAFPWEQYLTDPIHPES